MKFCPFSSLRGVISTERKAAMPSQKDGASKKTRKSINGFPPPSKTTKFLYYLVFKFVLLTDELTCTTVPAN